MDINLTHLAALVGIGVVTYGIIKYRKAMTSLSFPEVRYDPVANELHLVVENDSGKPVYVKPSVRVVRFTPIDEWKGTSSDNTNLSMMRASSGSVIKGYDLIGEYTESLLIGSKERLIIRYPVGEGSKLSVYDTLLVDTLVGESPYSLSKVVSDTVKVILKESEMDQTNVCVDSDIITGLKSEGLLDGALSKSPFEIAPFDGAVFTDLGDTPLEIMRAPQTPSDSMASLEDVSEDEQVSIELIESPKINLKPRHKELLGTLASQSTCSTKELAKILERGEKQVAQDLRYLLKNEMVDRVKIKNLYKYFVVRDHSQVMVHLGIEEEDDAPDLT